MITVAITVGFLVTFGVFIAAVTVAVMSEQRKNRRTMRQMEAEFDRIVSRLGHEEEGWR